MVQVVEPFNGGIFLHFISKGKLLSRDRIIVRIYINPQQFFHLFCVDRQGEPKGSDFSVCRLSGFNLHTHFFHVSSRPFFVTLPV